MENSHEYTLGLAAIFLLGTGAQWLGARFRIPSIILLLLFGFLGGPVTGIVEPEELLGELLFPVVSLSVAIILFEGALSLKLDELKENGGVLLSLLSLGVVITWVGATAAAVGILGFEFTEALLLGAILTVTGPTVIGPLLRHIRPAGRVGQIAKWEGIVVDPIGAVLAVLVFEAQLAVRNAEFEAAVFEASWGLLRTIGIGVPIGVGAAVILTILLHRHLIADHLESPVTLMFVVAAATLSNFFQHESGLLAVTVMGVTLANQRSASLRHITEFKESLSVLLISSLFILLTARLEIDQFTQLGLRGLLFVAVLILVVRPIAVFASMATSGLSRKERLFLSWLAPRGIVAASVSSVFALQMSAPGLVPATFLVIIGTVVVYGATAYPLARFLGLATANPQGILIAGAHPAARAIAQVVKEAGFRVLLVDTNRWHIQSARMEGLETDLANILSERARNSLDLGGIGRFLAMTPNDEVNSLAVEHFETVFGRANAYRLPPARRGGERRETSSELLRGRLLFDSELTAEELNRRLRGGAVVKSTPLTEEFDFDDFLNRYGPASRVLLVITEEQRVRIRTIDDEAIPTSGQTIIVLVEPIEEEPAAQNAEGQES